MPLNKAYFVSSILLKPLRGILRVWPQASPTSLCTQWLWLRFVEMDFHELAIMWQSSALALAYTPWCSLYFRAEQMNKHVLSLSYALTHVSEVLICIELLGGGLHSSGAFTVIFCFKLQRNKVAVVVSQHRHGGGQHGKQELVLRLLAIVLQSGREWAAEVSGVLGCRRLDQRQSRCVSSPPPLLSPGQACVFTHDLSAPLFCTAHNS